MIFLFKNKPIFSTIILLFFTCALSGYFIWQIFKGDLSVLNMQAQKTHLNSLVSDYEDNNLNIIFYENHINALDPKNLNIDVLEEEMRKKMLLTKRNEILLLPPHTPKAISP